MNDVSLHFSTHHWQQQKFVDMLRLLFKHKSEDPKQMTRINLLSFKRKKKIRTGHGWQFIVALTLKAGTDRPYFAFIWESHGARRCPNLPARWGAARMRSVDVCFSLAPFTSFDACARAQTSARARAHTYQPGAHAREWNGRVPQSAVPWTDKNWVEGAGGLNKHGGQCPSPPKSRSRLSNFLLGDRFASGQTAVT